MTRLFPRLTPAFARDVHQTLTRDLIPVHSQYEQRSSTTHRLATFGQTGGKQITEAELGEIKAEIEDLAKDNGYPYERKQSSLRIFDDECAILLRDSNKSPAEGEALRSDVWSFFGCVLLPHIVMWRFNSCDQKERFLGGIRNTFQRLYVRALAFDRGTNHPERWAVMKVLTEDAYSAILERPGLSANPRVALAIGENWLMISQRVGQAAMQKINRVAMKKLRAFMPVISPDALNDEQLGKLIEVCFETSSRDVGIPEGSRASEGLFRQPAT